ncbi:class A beta-lactamase [Streptomyces sp. NPDC048604]|uniref:class A beta-lactamase n=1 Tax=Streptomyces sp. NPDC048604 TaxID=3365578 RepID=UPI003716AFEB
MNAMTSGRRTGRRAIVILLSLLLTGTSVSAVATERPGGAPAPIAELRRIEREREVRIGAFAHDTATGRTLSHRADESFAMLSVFKAFAAAAILQKARRTDPGLLERTIHWTAADEVADSPVTPGRGEAGMTVAELCHAAVTRSDNTAGNLLLKQLGGPAGLTRFFRSLGDPVSRLDRREPELNVWQPGETRDTTTPAAAGATFARLAVGRALAPADRDRLNAWLRANETGDARIRAGLPDDWTVGDRTGTAVSAYGGAHDIAVATPPSGAPVILVVLTRRNAAGAQPDSGAVAATATALVRELGLLPRGSST